MGRDSTAKAIGTALLLGVGSLLSGCQRSPAPTENATGAAHATTPAVSRIGNRIRYAPLKRPVFVAPDGSRRKIASMLALPHRMTFGDFVWDDHVPGEGPVWMRVDLARQLISVFRGADEIGTAVILYGTDGKETPTGVFPLLGKERMHRSSLYDADMPFTMWLTHDGVAIHASSVMSGRATHGCIGVPEDFASKLFAVARRGDVAVVLPATATT